MKPIRNEADHQIAMKRIDELWDCAPGSPEADELEVLGILVDAFESKNYIDDQVDPIEYLKYVLDSHGLKPQGIAQLLGGSGRVSDILNRRRPLTINHIRKLTEALGASAEVLIRPYELAKA